MKFALFSVLAFEAAKLSHAMNLADVPQVNYDEQALAQLNAFVASENTNDTLAEALTKVMASLSSGQTLAQKDGGEAAETPAMTPAPKITNVPAPSGGKQERGTNIAITTATDQHINIWVPENPNAKVSVKKTEGVKIVESDSDKVDKNAAIKAAIGDKIRGELVKKALGSTTSGKKTEKDKEDDKADQDKIKSAQEKYESAKLESAKIRKMIEGGDKEKKTLAQIASTDLTEADIHELADLYAQVQVEDYTSEDEFAELEGDSAEESASSASSSDEFAQAAAEVEDGLDENQILGLAQIEAEQDAPKPVVSLTPNVHVQVTRVGYE